MIACPFITDCFGWNDNSAILDGTVQYAAIPQQNQTLAAHRHDILIVTDALWLPDIGLIKSKAFSLIDDLINRSQPNCRVDLCNLFWIKKTQDIVKQLFRKAGYRYIWKIFDFVYEHFWIDNSIFVWIKFMQQHKSTSFVLPIIATCSKKVKAGIVQRTIPALLFTV